MRPTLNVVLPGDIDDENMPSGGNTYDRRICDGLARVGWSVRELAIGGAWPRPAAAERAALAGALATLPDDATVLLDGLVACGVPEIVIPEARRLRLVVLVHLPLADETGLAPGEADELETRERTTLRAATLTVATSAWTAHSLIDRYGLDPARVQVAAPGVDAAPLAPGTDGASQLLCVAAVTPRKGQDLLVEALATITHLPWNCQCVGRLGRPAGYVDRLRGLIEEYGLVGRMRLHGPRAGTALDAAYASADLVVLASHAEPYGMVVTEALARGIPVLATHVDGIPEALGRAPDGTRPGMLVPAGDPTALAGALRDWLDVPDLRRRLRSSALGRRTTLDGWEVTSRRIADAVARARRAG